MVPYSAVDHYLRTQCTSMKQNWNSWHLRKSNVRWFRLCKETNKAGIYLFWENICSYNLMCIKKSPFILFTTCNWSCKSYGKRCLKKENNTAILMFCKDSSIKRQQPCPIPPPSFPISWAQSCYINKIWHLQLNKNTVKCCTQVIKTSGDFQQWCFGQHLHAQKQKKTCPNPCS